MSSSDDEDEQFLYGSDSENKSVDAKGQKRGLQTDDADNDKSVVKKPKVSEKSTTSGVGTNQSDLSNDSSEADDDESVSSEEESDSDVEFIISTGADSTRLDSASTSTSAVGAQSSGISVATAPAETIPEAAQVADVNMVERSTTEAVPNGSIDLEA